MPTLRDFIAKRKAEIREQMTALRQELSELQRAEAAISGEPASPSTRQTTAGQPGKGTIKDMILQVLEDRAKGAESPEVIDLIKARFDVEVPRTSMSPQLSRLKADGLLTIIGKNWILPKHAGAIIDDDANSNEPPSSDEVGGSEEDGAPTPSIETPKASLGFLE